MKLVIDVGNTLVKYGIYNPNHQLIIHRSIPQSSFLNEAKTLVSAYPQISHVMISASGELKQSWVDVLSEQKIVFYFSYDTLLPIQIDYLTPKTLGLDRIALAVAAKYQYPDQNCLVIDLGTCITYDFINEKGVYLGGAISPGVAMRFKAMHTFTAKLPLINHKEEITIKYIGKTTKECLQIGVIQAIKHEIQGFIDDYSTNYKDLTVVLTGGNALLLAGQLKNSIFANLNLQLAGLYKILIYNINALKK